MKGKHILVLIALCGFAAASVGITLNTAGVFYAPIAEDLGVGRGSISLMMTICSISGAVIGLFVPKLMKESRIRIMIAAAVVLLVGATVGLSFAKTLFQFYALSVIRGFGSGMVSFVTITMILNNWFHASHGLITSIAMAFSGVPGVILSPVFSGIIESSGWRQAYLVVAACALVCCLPGLLFPISLRPEKQGLKPYGYEEFQKAKAEGRTIVLKPGEEEFNYASPVFLLAMLFTICVCVIASLAQHLPGYATSIGYTASIGSLMLSITSAVNIGSKLLFGVMSDKIGGKTTMLTMASLSLAGLAVLLFVPNTVGMFLGAGLYAFSFSNSAVGIAICAQDLFGLENYSKAYPMMSFIGGCIGAFGTTLIGMVYDVSGSYVPNIWMMLILQATVILSLVTAYGIRKKQA